MKLITSLNIATLNTSALSQRRGSNGSIDVATFKDMYLNYSLKERRKSTSVDSRVSSRSKWRSSVEKIENEKNKEKSKDLWRTEIALEYLLGCPKVKLKLSSIWQEV